MVCNRSEWLQNREFSGTILPIETIKAAKKVFELPYGIHSQENIALIIEKCLHSKAYIPLPVSTHAPFQLPS